MTHDFIMVHADNVYEHDARHLLKLIPDLLVFIRARRFQHNRQSMFVKNTDGDARVTLERPQHKVTTLVVRVK